MNTIHKPTFIPDLLARTCYLCTCCWDVMSPLLRAGDGRLEMAQRDAKPDVVTPSAVFFLLHGASGSENGSCWGVIGAADRGGVSCAACYAILYKFLQLTAFSSVRWD